MDINSQKEEIVDAVGDLAGSVEIEVEGESLNPNIEDQLESAPTDLETDVRTPEEKVQEYLETEEELKEYGDGVQKRIKKLTYNWRESERREQAAIEYAQGVQREIAQLKVKQTEQDGVFINEYKQRIEAELLTAKQQYKEAHDLGDASLLADANQNIARYSSELVNAEQTANRFKRQVAQPVQQNQAPVQQAQPQQVQRQQIQPDAKATNWADENKWFGEDSVMTNAAMTVHQELISSGYAPESDEYYNQINSRMRTNFPHKFQAPRQRSQQQVTPGGQSAVPRKSGKRQVKLTPSQVRTASRLGVSLEEYAKYV